MILLSGGLVGTELVSLGAVFAILRTLQKNAHSFTPKTYRLHLQLTALLLLQVRRRYLPSVVFCCLFSALHAHHLHCLAVGYDNSGGGSEFWNDTNARPSGLSDVLRLRATQLAISTNICYAVSSLYCRNASYPAAKHMPATMRQQKKHGGKINSKHAAYAFQRHARSWKNLTRGSAFCYALATHVCYGNVGFNA